MMTTINTLGASFVTALATLFESYPTVALYYTTVARYLFVLLALFIVGRGIKSLLGAKSPPEIWAYLSLPGGHIAPILHWENVVGRSSSCDLHVDVMTVSRNHGTLVRNGRGEWYYRDLGSKGGSLVNGVPVHGTTRVQMGDTLTLGGVQCVLMPPSLEEKQHNLDMRKRYTKPFSPWASLLALTIFQILTCLQFIAAQGSELSFQVLLAFGLFTLLMWIYCLVMRGLHQIAFEMETIVFFLCTINLAVVASSAPSSIMKELVAIALGLGLFIVMCWYLRDLHRGLGIRRLLVLISGVLFLINILFGSASYGSVNWVSIAGYSLQPSELVKIAYIFVGAATLDELYEKHNLRLFVGFSLFCFACLAIMNDFGTAATFFVTFLVISFLRSGEMSKLILTVGTCGAGALMMIRFVPHITQRFSTWLHVWDFPDAGGYQQVRALAAGASGGCLGLGAGNGWFNTIFASDTDLVFSLVSEEWGLIIALLMVFSLIALGLFAVRSIRFGRSTFFTIAACAATSLIIFQTILNVLGSLDILPFTGVTLPFISNGGTSMLASWGLLAFLKAADTRQNASLAVQSLSADVEDAFDLESLPKETAPEAISSPLPAEPAEPFSTGLSVASTSVLLDNPYDDLDRTPNVPDFDAIYAGDSTVAGRRSRRSKPSLGKELRDDMEKWLQFDADTDRGKSKVEGPRSRRNKNRTQGGEDDTCEK